MTHLLYIDMPQVIVEKTKGYLVVKIPLNAARRRMELSGRARKIVDEAISEGLIDIEAGKVVGPFKNVKEIQRALARK